ncbi:hypothetical protein A2671_01300 [Candidatus Kaiserbacteria bacterium RIFCSPHIGHO2_01_FULL_49_13]|uniref:Uncharacterized protein n=1 Tax=Candidatus Kaiserbacteria bacterium RIFCSPHIGHO2_01_FULL_49_13 TaxID=1798477 RepID=A0A1F6CDL5_9BACT|nr:MAG: hypothetical protein A2671_01300 [Candidatus Kaiserbacteria bacterium RIFCSPHIGHO2_01_FULL_49_13]
MADAMQETDAGIELALMALKRLKERNPTHELLQYADSFATLSPPRSFIERFGREHVPEYFRGTEFAAAAMYLNFYNTLEAAQ